MKCEVNIIIQHPTNGTLVLTNLGDKIDQIKFNTPTLMAIDGSTTCTGVAFLDEKTGAYYASVAMKREKGETPVEYKVAFKKALKTLLASNPGIAHVVYEEPFIEFAGAAKNLLMLGTSVEELIVENKPLFDYIKYVEVANGKWKKMFLAPNKVPAGTENQKEAVRAKLVAALPMMARLTQDEVDATAMGYVSVVEMARGNEENLKSKKKVRPFQYEVEFFGADDDDIAFQQISDESKAPDVLKAGQIGYTIQNKYRQLDELVCETIGDTDTLQIIRMIASKCGNLALKYHISALTDDNKYLYIVCWRKHRK